MIIFKKILSFIITGILILSLGACVNNEDMQPTTKESVISSSDNAALGKIIDYAIEQGYTFKALSDLP